MVATFPSVEKTQMPTERYLDIIKEWWESSLGAPPTRGNVAGGLVLLEHLRANPVFDIRDHQTKRGTQLKRATPTNLRNILARFDETRVLSKEAGRTNRGLMRNFEPLLDVLSTTPLDRLDIEDRDSAINAMQSFLVDRARDILNADWISFDYSPGASSREIVDRILRAARDRHKAGDVAEYLVGAKLAVRFPNYEIRNSAASAADDQTDEQGDFQINNSVFHVTIAPNLGHYVKCRQNLAGGYRAFLLVPDDRLSGARQNAEQEIGENISVESIQSFVSQNIEELSEFSGDKVALWIRSLLEKYNERVSQVETDLSLLIRIPGALEEPTISPLHTAKT
jgi:hypothetical protein